uniref:Peroxisomal biogenesis factor 3 n=1 Tax=Homalodisca liturata TaxID=320908 RepID=A0A1B6J9X2_9HEMI
MISYFKEVVKRHKKKIIFIGIVVGGAVLGSRYAQRRLIEWQEKETKEFLERTRKQHYFESTEKTCNQTIIFLSSTLREKISNCVNCDEILNKLRQGASNKVELWEELKVLVFTKVSLLIYCGTLLVIALRIQLNIIGGHIYVKTLVQGSDNKISSELQEEYLSQSNYFLNSGVENLYPLVREKVSLTLKDVTLKQNLTLQHVENIFWAIQSAINDDPRNPIKVMSQLFYGSDFEEQDIFIKDMISDTIDLLQSSEVMDLASSCISRGFSYVIDRLSEFFLPEENNIISEFPTTSDKSTSTVRFAHPNSLSKPFAKIIPLINGFGNPRATSELPEQWISPFIYMDRVKMLGANVYESYSCPVN